MNNQDIFIAQPQSGEQQAALVAFLKSLKIKFEVAKTDKTERYNPDFVAKILESKEQAQNGHVTRVGKDSLKALLGL